MTFRSSILTILYVLPLAVAIISSGCSAFTNRLAEEDPLLLPPNVIDDPGQIICRSETPAMCAGFLTDKPIDLD
tara:strand:+ start:1211 stop:1432 length:222 start_codon:yes stop_codon:yes gene_type:complete